MLSDKATSSTTAYAPTQDPAAAALLTKVRAAYKSCTARTRRALALKPQASGARAPSAAKAPDYQQNHRDGTTTTHGSMAALPGSSSGAMAAARPRGGGALPYGLPRARTRGFRLLHSLPVDLQLHLLSFLWIKTSIKTLARVDRYWAYLVDEYVRARVLYHLRPPAAAGARSPDAQRWFDVQLLFEAQRPIDTTSIKHGLYFSHFSISNSLPALPLGTVREEASARGRGRGLHGDAGSDDADDDDDVRQAAQQIGVYTTFVNFAFVPPADDAHSKTQELPPYRAPPAGRGATHSQGLSQGQGQAQGLAPARFSAVDEHGILAAEQPAAAVYNLPHDLAGRVRPAEHFSSIIDTSAPGPSSASASGPSSASASASAARSRSSSNRSAMEMSRSDSQARGRSDSVRGAGGAGAGPSSDGFTFVAAPLYFRDDLPSGSGSGSGSVSGGGDSSSSASVSFPPASFEAAPFPFLQAPRAAVRPVLRARAASATSSDGRLASPPRYRHAVDTPLASGVDAAAGSALDVYAHSSGGIDMVRASSSSTSHSRLRSNTGRDREARDREARESGGGGGQRRLPRHLKPAYAFQLDPLDSFETWILTLSIHRTDHDLTPAFVHARAAHAARSGQGHEHAGPGALAFDQPFWTQRRMVEGLERIYREWFRPPAGGGGGGAQDIGSLFAGDAAAAAAAAGASVRSRARLYQVEMAEDERAAILPPARTLEVDNKPSCALAIQPHPCDKFAEHPALAGTSGSHSWLSYSSFGSQYGPGSGMGSIAAGGGYDGGASDRVEFTFHCEEMRINAARLLSAFEALESELAIKKLKATQEALTAREQAAAKGIALPHPSSLSFTGQLPRRFAGRTSSTVETTIFDMRSAFS